jgi:AraC-like DNA-binding protein
MKNFDISNLQLTSICDVRRVNHSKDTEASATASHCALIIRKSGSSVYTVKKSSFTADSDTLLFIAKGTKYSMSVEKSGECTVVQFDVNDAQLAECFPDGGIFEYFTAGDKSILKLAKSLMQYYGLRGPAYNSKCLSELYSLITQISTIHAFNHSLAGKYGLIHASVKFIEANYARQDLYTPMLAELSDMGETYYRSIFQAVFNMPPARYIQLYRVGKAKELLLNSNQSIEEIAVAVGFANASYFCKVFKNLTGKTPSEFAQKCKTLG